MGEIIKTGYFTTYEALMFFDLASNNPSETIQSFFNKIFNLEYSPKKLKTIHINRLKTLTSAKTIQELIEQNDRSEIIQAIRENLRSDCVTTYLNDLLIDYLDSAKNIGPKIRKDIITGNDFATNLFSVLDYTLDYQDDDNKRYSNLYKKPNEEYPYASLFDKLDEIEQNDIKNKAIDTKRFDFIRDLTTISNEIYSEIKEQANHINKKILSVALPTDGINNKETLPLSTWFDTDKNLFIVGDGGVGKTTALINQFEFVINESNNKYIPIYIKLTQLKHNSLSYTHSYIKSAIISRLASLEKNACLSFNSIDTENMLNSFINDSSSQKRLLLLLDGFNEISNEVSSSIRVSIENEIKAISSCTNVRIILTSRKFYEYEKYFNKDNGNFELITAVGISNNTLDDFLDEEKLSIPESKELYKLIHNPLFLIMYKANHDNNASSANTRGGLIYEFCNGNSSIYTELLKNKSTELPKYTPILYDFIMPAMAAKMEMDDKFHITLNELDDIIKNVEALTMPFDSKSDPYFKKYEARGTITNQARAIPTIGDELIEILTDHISFIEQDAYGNLSFIHQYIKDYFSALFRIFIFRQASISNNSLYFEYVNSLWDYSTLDLTKEIAEQSKLCNLTDIKDSINLCINKSNPYYINNLMTSYSAFNNNTLAGAVFDSFDFSNVALTKYKFFDETGSAHFINCNFSESSFLAYDNTQKILRALSFYDEKPAMHELVIDHWATFYRIIDLNTKNEVYTEDWDFYSNDSHMDFAFANDMHISNDQKYLLIYDNEFKHDFFYIYNKVTKQMSKHYLPVGITSALFTFADNLLYVATDIAQVVVYDLNYEEPEIDINSLDAITDEDSIDLYDYEIPELEYTGIVDTIEFDATSFYQPFVPRKSLHSFFVYDNYLVFFFVSDKLEKVIDVYSLKDKKFVAPTIPQYVDHYLTEYMTTFQYDNYFYFSHGDVVYEYDVKANELAAVFHSRTLSLNSHIARANNLLYVLGHSNIYVYDLEKKTVINTIESLGLSYKEQCLINKSGSYLLIGSATSYSVNAIIYRTDSNKTYDVKYGSSNHISYICHLKDDRILNIYSSGHLALLDSNTLELIDVDSLPRGFSILHATYNPVKEQLALLLSNDDSFQNEIVILDISAKEIKGFKVIAKIESDNISYAMCFSNDGSVLLDTNGLDTIRIYETNQFAKINEQKYNVLNGIGIAYLIPFKNIIYALCGGDAYILEPYISYELLTIDINDIHEQTELSHIRYAPNIMTGEYDSTCINKIGIDLYEITYPQLAEDAINEKFVYLPNSNDNRKHISDYYEEGLLIKCSDRNILGLPDDTIRLSNMTTRFAHVDKTKNSFYCVNRDNRFCKTDLTSKVSTLSSVVPGLMIKNCIFEFDTMPSYIIQNIIDNNLGIIK